MQRETTPNECVVVLLPRDVLDLSDSVWNAIAGHLALAAAELARHAPADDALTLRFSVERV